MARPKKNGKYLNVCIQEEIYKKLEEFCLEAGQTKTIAVERALAQYIENYRRVASCVLLCLEYYQRRSPKPQY